MGACLSFIKHRTCNLFKYTCDPSTDPYTIRLTLRAPPNAPVNRVYTHGNPFRKMSFYVVSMAKGIPSVLFGMGIVGATVCGASYFMASWTRLGTINKLEKKLAEIGFCEEKHDEDPKAFPRRLCKPCNLQANIGTLKVDIFEERKSFKYMISGGALILSSYLLSDVYTAINF
jgi:hypothetical protein